MNNEKQRIAIAEACGWKPGRCPCGEELCDAWKTPTGDNWEYVPDYLNDLNAMHEAEKTLNELQLVAYSDKLYDLAVEHQRKTGKWCYLSMSASQRAEAFLRTIGKWEEA
jgi:hypothetical protein